MKQRKLRQRIFAVLMCLVLCLTFMPANIAKAEAKDITVLVAISYNGDFVTDKNGDKVDYVEVTLSGKSGEAGDEYIISDALRQAHKDLHPDGESGYGDAYGSYGLSLTKLWGDVSGLFGYYVNNASAWSLEDTVEDGDMIHAFVYGNSDWSDTFVFFSEYNVTSEVNEETALTLNYYTYDASWNPIATGYEGANIYINGTLADGKVTDAEGKVSLTFDAAGEYVITAKKTNNAGKTAITAAQCVITVSEAQTEPTPEPTPEPIPEPTPVAPALSTDSVDDIVATGIDSGAAYLEGTFGDELVYGYEWYVINMLRAGKELGGVALENYYDSVVEEVKNWTTDEKPTEIARVALALSAMGQDITDVGGVNLAAMLYNHPSLDSGSNELIYALLALDARDIEIPADAKWTRDAIVNKLLAMQNTTNGGFGLFDNVTTSVDVTAMALQALAPYKSSNPAVATAMENGVNYLKNSMSSEYAFDNNSNSTAQVLMALSILGIDPTVAANGFGDASANMIKRIDTFAVAGANGFAYKYGEKVNNLATIQIMQALNAYKLFKTDGTSYWDFSKMVDILDANLDNSVKTGDNMPLVPVSGLAIMCMIGIICLRKKERITIEK